MDDRARRTYRGFGTLFLVLGGAFLALGLVPTGIASDAVEGGPVPVALLLLLVGAGLHWTVRDRGEGADDAVADAETEPAGIEDGERDGVRPDAAARAGTGPDGDASRDIDRDIDRRDADRRDAHRRGRGGDRGED